jgi:hypothetical protein
MERVELRACNFEMCGKMEVRDGKTRELVVKDVQKFKTT